MGKSSGGGGDTVGAARETGRQARWLAAEQTLANRPMQINPWGSTTWLRTPVDPKSPWVYDSPTYEEFDKGATGGEMGGGNKLYIPRPTDPKVPVDNPNDYTPDAPLIGTPPPTYDKPVIRPPAGQPPAQKPPAQKLPAQKPPMKKPDINPTTQNPDGSYKKWYLDYMDAMKKQTPNKGGAKSAAPKDKQQEQASALRGKQPESDYSRSMREAIQRQRGEVYRRGGN